MNRIVFALALSAAPALAQAPPVPSNQVNPNAPAPTPAPTTIETSRVSHVVSGPNGRVQGLLLRNGSFVTLSPRLSQQISTSIRHNATVNVSGPVYGIGSDKTIQARQLMIAGVSYSDNPAFGGPPAGAQAPPPPPPPPGGPRDARPPHGRRKVPPPPQCTNGVAPPPEARPASAEGVQAPPAAPPAPRSAQN